jgi:hypothetical protein
VPLNLLIFWLITMVPDTCAIRTQHFAEIVNWFMSAAVPSNVIGGFRNGELWLAGDAAEVHAVVRRQVAGCLLPWMEGHGLPELPFCIQKFIHFLESEECHEEKGEGLPAKKTYALPKNLQRLPL